MLSPPAPAGQSGLVVRVAALTIVILVTANCDPGTTYEFRNSTDSVVAIRFDGELLVSRIPPGGTWKFTTIDPQADFPVLIEAVGPAGTVIFAREYSFNEARQLDYRFEIPP